VTRRKPRYYGLMAEFDSPTAIVEATRRAYAEGYRRMDTYTPFPVEGLAEEMHFHRTGVPLIVLLGGLAGCLGGYFLQYWISGAYWPLNIAGRPLNSWPMFIPVTFELTILVAALSALVGMLALNGLPHPHHPVFNVPRFALASQDRFFLCIETSDPRFNRDATRDFLESLAPREVNDVEY
jgi:hypothetical protein